MLDIAEVFCHGQTGQADAHTRSGRFIHLAVDQRSLGKDAGLLHLVVEVVPLAAAFADAGEHGAAVVGGCNIVDKLLNENCLADARAAEQSDFTAFGVGADQVDDLDAGLENFSGGFLLLKRRRFAVDRQALHSFGEGGIVQRLTQQVEDAAKAGIADRDGDGTAGVDGFHAARQAVGRAHGDAADDTAADLLLHLCGDGFAVVLQRDSIEQVRKLRFRETDVEHRAGDLDDGADIFG